MPPYLRSVMRRYLRPTQVYESIHDIDFNHLYRDLGLRHLFFDVDNTLIPYSQTTLSVQTLNLFRAIRPIGFSTIGLISNNSNYTRIQTVSQQLNCPAAVFACKPFVFTMRRLLDVHQASPHESAIIGDQLLTDIALGNYLNMHTIFVDPIEPDGVSAFKAAQYRWQQRYLSRL
jgi:HAD superfamily phosphatase (TIGR01668 family)